MPIELPSESMNDQLPKTVADESPKPKRRWFQFSLRTLMGIMLVFGCVMGWLAFERRKIAVYQNDVEALRKLSGKFETNDNPRVNPPWLQMILGDDSYKEIVGVFLLGENCIVDITRNGKSRRINPRATHFFIMHKNFNKS